MAIDPRQYTLYRLPFGQPDEPWNWLIEVDPFDILADAETASRRFEAVPANLDRFKVVDEPRGYGA